MPRAAAPQSRDALAAVDLGSNSFHMLIADMVHGEPVIVDRLRDQVQLAAGLDSQRMLNGPPVDRALACLERFGQRLRGVPTERVRVVGTNTLRAARNGRQFISAAEDVLGHRIEVISGHEEARLIYLGTAHTLSDDAGTRLVVDIGGGSTECILGERFEAIEVHSLDMGCVHYSLRHFPEGRIDEARMAAAELAARREVVSLEYSVRDAGWHEAVGASGTIRAVRGVLRENEWSRVGISAEGLLRLRQAIVAAGHVDALQLAGLKAERRSVFPGGVAILCAIFAGLRIGQMRVASGALREGLLFDLLGRIRHEDVRERTIRQLQERYHVDRVQAGRVERTALGFLRQASRGWKFDGEESERFLAWAARVHEIGLAVSYPHHHRHGAYLLRNSDLPGFSRDDQQLLATLVEGHRRRPEEDLLSALPQKAQRLVVARLLAVLRLAVVLNRERSPQPFLPVRLECSKQRLAVHLPRTWLEAHSLTRGDLEEEAKALRELDIRIELEPFEG